jgi:hypothetical protein
MVHPNPMKKTIQSLVVYNANRHIEITLENAGLLTDTILYEYSYYQPMSSISIVTKYEDNTKKKLNKTSVIKIGEKDHLDEIMYKIDATLCENFSHDLKTFVYSF